MANPESSRGNREAPHTLSALDRELQEIRDELRAGVYTDETTSEDGQCVLRAEAHGERICWLKLELSDGDQIEILLTAEDLRGFGTLLADAADAAESLTARRARLQRLKASEPAP